MRSLPSILPLPSRVGDLDLAGFLSVDRSQVGFVFLPDAYLFVIIVYAVDRIAYEQAVVDVFLHLGILQAYQLLLVAVIREVHPQVEVLRFHGDGREAYLPAAVAGVADVRPRPVEARSIGQHLEVEQVVALRIVIVDRTVDTSLEEPEVEADVEHLVALPLQVGRRAGFGLQPPGGAAHRR